MYFQPPGLKAFFHFTGLKPGAGTSRPIAVPLTRSEARGEGEVIASSVTALGRLIPEGETIALAMPNGAGDARIARLFVDEGDSVAAGDVIAELDSLPQLEAALASTQANVQTREAALAQTRINVAASLAETRAARDRAAAAADLAQRELARVQDLAQRGVMPQSRLDSAEAHAIETARELDRLTATLSRWQGGEAQGDITLAERQLDQARAELERARRDMARGRVIAPQAGAILDLHARAGERPDQRGVATLGSITHMQAELEVYQDDIARVHVGQRVRLTAPALDTPLEGEVVRIGLEVERQSVLSSDPVAHTDARIIRVLVSLDPASSQRARALSGLEVVASLGANLGGAASDGQ
ncbi:efflux RND transporter periplasmic adaptor subunit [Woodsholea maritima]|uniref:efflux RND transporter periplasmic adaptor subunit n=1 Tax=Woodsholea maritima TaxID=240237 RepID=UPI0014613103|nr:efflux RND transporter periplasmic adaptor subunit [Woodsholea maritima]